MNHLLWLRNDVKTESELRPIYLRITINGKRAEFSTGIFVMPSCWDAKNKVITSSVIQQNDLLNWVNTFLERVKFVQYLLQKENRLFTVNELKIRLHKIDEKPLTVTELCDKYRDYLISNPDLYATNTPAHYSHRIAHYKRFLKIVGLDGEGANYILTSHLDKFVGYLDTVGLKKSYQNKIIGCVKGMYNWACSTGVLQNNPVSYYKNVRPSKPTKVYLNDAQIKQIEAYKFSSSHIQKAADLFIFQFHTGLAYVDTQAFNFQKHCQAINGVSWIIIERQKSGTITRVPMSSIVLKLIANYQGEAPKIVMQRYNLYLKEIANILGLDVNLTSHVGRKTALNNWLESGIKLETVSAMAGHSSTKVTQSHYTDVSITKMENDISPHFLALNVLRCKQELQQP